VLVRAGERGLRFIAIVGGDLRDRVSLGPVDPVGDEAAGPAEWRAKIGKIPVVVEPG
jgi:hypothetical protein